MRVNQLSDLTHDEFMRLNTLKVPDLPKGHIPYAGTDRGIALTYILKYIYKNDATQYVSIQKIISLCSICTAFPLC